MSLKQLSIMILIIILIGLIYNYTNLDHLKWCINNFELIFFISYFLIIYIIYYVPWIIIFPFTLIAN